MSVVLTARMDVDRLAHPVGGWELRIVLPLLALGLVSLGECPPRAVSVVGCVQVGLHVLVQQHGISGGQACVGVLASPRHTHVFSLPVPQLQWA